MASCEQFEIAIEMRLHGALESDAHEDCALTAHLADCASCRAFEDLAKGMETAMVGRTETHLQAIDWDAFLSRTVVFVERQARQRLVTGALVLCAPIPMVILMGFPANGWTVFKSLASGTLVLAALWLKSRWTVARAYRSRGDGDELMFVYRRELEERLRATMKVAFFAPAWLLVFFLIFHPHLLGFFGAMGVMASVTAYNLIVKRPSLRRELDALKADLNRK